MLEVSLTFKFAYQARNAAILPNSLQQDKMQLILQTNRRLDDVDILFRIKISNESRKMLHSNKRFLAYFISGLLIIGAIALGVYLWKQPSSHERMICRCMEAECHPVWRDLYDGKINAGDDLDDTLALTQPSKIIKEGRSTFLIYYQDYDKDAPVLYFTGVSIESIDGKLISAHSASCTWTFQFFDKLHREEDYFPFGHRSLPGGRAISLSPK